MAGERLVSLAPAGIGVPRVDHGSAEIAESGPAKARVMGQQDTGIHTRGRHGTHRAFARLSRYPAGIVGPGCANGATRDMRLRFWATIFAPAAEWEDETRVAADGP